MRMMKVFYHTGTILFLFFMACSQDGPTLPNERQALAKLPGTIYWYFAGDVGYLEPASGKASLKMMKMGAASSYYDSFDISWDNKKVVLTMDVEGTFNFNERRFVMRNKDLNLDYTSLKDGQNQFDMTYDWKAIKSTDAYVSPNERYLALSAQHFSDMPLTIVDTKTGQQVSSWLVKGISFLKYGKPVWTADNTLYFRIGDAVYKCSPSDGYNSAPHVFSLVGMSDVTVNPQGTKLAFRKDKHIWLYDLKSGHLEQVTTGHTSDTIDYDGEHQPTFSPDGRYLAFTGAMKRGTPWSDHDYPDGSWVAATGGKYGYIVVVPADGTLYDLENKDSGAIWLPKPGSANEGIACGGYLIWR